ncbi:MAG: hypothetical protein HY000_05825 [Planctomycetes bacterium]|nr:hypothetical protein [Planctomycetota bacterium]
MFRDTLAMRLRGAYLTFHRRANAHFERSGVTADQFVMLTVGAPSSAGCTRTAGRFTASLKTRSPRPSGQS